MTGPFTLAHVDELVTRSHSDGVTDLAAAALIKHDVKFLLVRTATRDLNTPPAWDLPTGPVLPGGTVVDGLHRILAQALGYSNAKTAAFLGIVDADNGTHLRLLDHSGPARQRLLGRRHPAPLDRQHRHQRPVPWDRPRPSRLLRARLRADPHRSPGPGHLRSPSPGRVSSGVGGIRGWEPFRSAAEGEEDSTAGEEPRAVDLAEGVLVVADVRRESGLDHPT